MTGNNSYTVALYEGDSVGPVLASVLMSVQLPPVALSGGM